MTNRELFLSHVAQTSPSPIGLEIVRANGITLTDKDGKQYIDLISGFSVCNTGHSHPAVVDAVKTQVENYSHLIVYGEFIQSPQVAYAKLLTDNLPPSLDCVYFTNSGAEATEGAMKLAKRVNGRPHIIACNNAYHGSTQGALSIMGSEYWRNAFRPLLPGVFHLPYNSDELIEAINDDTACVFLEPVQAESGINKPSDAWLKRVRQKCNEAGALLVFDEIQAGFGRTGSLWAFQQYDVVPDILLLGKALGGGMPLGAFIASHSMMQQLTINPVLGHITTFGGHPVSCAAGMAAMQVLLQSRWIEQVKAKEQLFLSILKHERIKAVRSAGLWVALEFENFELCKAVIDRCIANGLISDWFLFAPNCMRIAPPLIITEDQLRDVCNIIIKAIP